MAFHSDDRPLLPADLEQTSPDMASADDHSSIYYIYRERNDPMLITTTQQPKTQKQRRKKQKEDPSSIQDPNGYFVHRPYLSFARPPRTLRSGASRDGRTICLIHSYAGWRRWRLQFGRDLGEAIDPRGVVQWQRRSNADNSVKADGDLKGIGCVVGDYGGSLGRRTIVRQIVSGSRGCGLKTILRVIDLYEPLRRAG